MKTPDLSDPHQAWGRCLLESQQVVQSTPGALYVRVTGNSYPGREHWAVLFPCEDGVLDGRVLDLTARQFSPTAPSPWNGSLDDWLDDCCEWLHDGVDYEIRHGFNDDIVLYRDSWIREDIEPGPMPRIGATA